MGVGVAERALLGPEEETKYEKWVRRREKNPGGETPETAPITGKIHFNIKDFAGMKVHNLYKVNLKKSL